MEIFVGCAPGLERSLADEMAEAGFGVTEVLTGGVQFRGVWADVWRANTFNSWYG